MQVVNATGNKKSVINLIKAGAQEFYRHGDVLLVRVKGEEELEKNASKLVATGKTVVQEGEITGHAHRLSGVGSAQTEIFANMENPDERYVAVIGQEGATLTHEEHKQIDLEEGLYKVVIEREHDPTTQMNRTVYD